MLLITRLVVIIIWIFISCTDNIPQKYIISDFESDTDLDKLHWKCHTLFFLSQHHVTHGNNSLKMELYPSHYPGLTQIFTKTDWSCYKNLCFDIYNTEQNNIQINIRIDDRKDALRYKDRYNKGFILKPGLNRIQIPLDTLLTSVIKKKLNLKNIYKLIIFMHRPVHKVVLYIDYLRLEI